MAFGDKWLKDNFYDFEPEDVGAAIGALTGFVLAMYFALRNIENDSILFRIVVGVVLGMAAAFLGFQWGIFFAVMLPVLIGLAVIWAIFVSIYFLLSVFIPYAVDSINIWGTTILILMVAAVLCWTRLKHKRLYGVVGIIFGLICILSFFLPFKYPEVWNKVIAQWGQIIGSLFMIADGVNNVVKPQK
mgnify:CR=1 FL=1